MVSIDRHGTLGKARRWARRAATAGLLAGSAAAAAATPAACAPDWPRWDEFKHGFLSADGRVVDVGSADERTVSEGQAYALLFALIANDRATFDEVLRWTENNLAQGDLTSHLPAWLWGRDKDGSWHVLDANAASDADLWIAYTLLQAGRLWHERSYTARGTVLARHIVEQETATLPGLGLTLLPGPQGFHPNPDEWRINPSYMPLQVMQGLAEALPEDARWKRLADSASAVVLGTAPQGFAPDWALYGAGRGFGPDTDTHAQGSYDAIRVYLWAGMLDPAQPGASQVLARLTPFADYIVEHGAPYESIDTTNAQAKQTGNSGFSAAAVPFLTALGRSAAATAQAERVRMLEAQNAPGYYSSVLTLFGLGWRDGRYRFKADGALELRWRAACASEGR
ncbi:cellulose synthase complex periplasmic endoglucanase BcsZ [Trinickia diaoshuihuensis]|uniref:cellulose synthase complex periplasmic endoglucanase BcsZ n=1 Tax=Trinickia diaoshuihuensis TaxID=2292265 RepID=UPI000E279A4C|nr:cellulose synthase complex periplasmic endoglucanase BcsZ [Trinickia diaoshuihuensis]